jgi:hypothetical protein
MWQKIFTHSLTLTSLPQVSNGAANVPTASLTNTPTVHIPGIGPVQILNMATQFQGLPAGTQILSPGTQFQAAAAAAGQFATAAVAQPAVQQALQQDPLDSSKWHVVQGSISQNFVSAEKFSGKKISSTNFGQKCAPKQ